MPNPQLDETTVRLALEKLPAMIAHQEGAINAIVKQHHELSLKIRETEAEIMAGGTDKDTKNASESWRRAKVYAHTASSRRQLIELDSNLAGAKTTLTALQNKFEAIKKIADIIIDNKNASRDGE